MQEQKIGRLKKNRFGAAMVDPYPPGIGNLLLPPKDEGPAPAATPETVARPAPSPRAVPDAG